MARPKRCRRICGKPEFARFSPIGAKEATEVVLTLDEFEVLRLLDFEGRKQDECAEQMQISRTTVTAIYDQARQKIARCLVLGQSLTIDGGDFRICRKDREDCCGHRCWFKDHPDDMCLQTEEMKMRIAVTYENGFVFQHFGKSEQFKIYDAENGKIVHEEVISTNGAGHGALAGFLTENHVDLLICGGLGMGARNALAASGIELYAGVNGPADAAVMTLLHGNLEKNDSANCHHHEDGEHDCGTHEEHGCGGHYHH